MRRALAVVLPGLLALGVGAAILPLENDEDGDLPRSLVKLPWAIFASGERGERTARATFGQTDFGKIAIKKILAKHNEYREAVSPRTSNMKYMTWDPVLATMAQQWAERCRFEHPSSTASNPSSFEHVGQNIFVREGNPNKPIPAAEFVQHWHSEVSSYNYNSNNCPPQDCGHYTQVVWADSYKIGCGLNYCSSVSGRSNAWLVVCNYGPAGNFYDADTGRPSKPYETGESCSQCDKDVPFCFRGLCHQCNPQANSDCVCTKICKNCGTLNPSRCTCSCPNGFHGTDCGDICRDTHDYCGRSPGWPDESFCSFDPMVPIGCPLMCDECRAQDRNYSCANPNGSSAPRPPSGGGTVTKPKKKKKKNKKGKKNKKRGGKKKKGRRPQ